ncbi:substrate-binding domain-containing protein [Nonomuraea sp. NPDC004297]
MPIPAPDQPPPIATADQPPPPITADRRYHAAVVPPTSRRRSPPIVTRRRPAAVVRGLRGAVQLLDGRDALGGAERLAQRGVRVPADISAIGFDDIFVHPSLTTLAGPGSQAGRIAAELLIEQLAIRSQRGGEAVRLPTELVLRESSGPAPAAPSDVTAVD